MKDYSVLEKIRKSADSCEIPESLKPENLDFEKKGNLRNIYSRGPWKKAAAAAAVQAAPAVIDRNNLDTSDKQTGRP